MLNQLLARRVLIVLGKGGVGKTAVSAALGLIAAQSGGRVLLMECDLRAPLGAAFDAAPSFEPHEVAPNLATMVLEGRRALEEYLRLVLPGRAFLRVVFASRLYQFFVQAAPGLRELMMLGKIYYESERKGGFDLIILDAPSSGQAISLLKMPAAARATFGESIVGHEANNIERMLRDQRRCAIVQVTTDEPLAVSETLENQVALEAMQLEPAAIFFNRLSRPAFDARDVTSLARSREGSVAPEYLSHLAGVARGELQRAERARKTLADTRTRIDTLIIALRDHPGLHGTQLIHELARELAANQDTAPAQQASEP
jgi:anion-transporting  ArsA/GET3 family ATPase